MLESEAKMKWCPMVHYRQTIAIDKDATEHQMQAAELTSRQSKCIGSDCALWVEDKSTDCHSGITRVYGGHCGLINK